MLKFQHRLILLLSTILIVSFLALGLIIHYSIHTILTDKQQRTLNNEAHTYVYLAEHRQFSELSKIANEREITIKIDKDNREVYSNDNNNSIDTTIDQPSYEQDHRSEGMTYTYSDQIDQHKIWIKGINNEIADLQLALWKYLAIVCLFVLFILYLVSRVFNSTFIRPIQEVTYATKLLADGYYHIRVPESNVKETRDLFVTTNNLARRLQTLNNIQKIQSNRLKTTVQNIPSGVLMIDKTGEVVVANEAYYQLFNINHNIKHQSYKGYISDEVEQLILECFKVEKAIYDQKEVKINNVHTKYFDISCVPILTKSKKSLQGIVLVMHDITNLKRLENLRREFVANVSHELKTPITSIKGFTETLIDGAKNDEHSLDMFLNIILKESNRIESLVTDLLDLSYIEQHKELETEAMDLSELTLRTVDNLMTQAQDKNIEINKNIDDYVIIQAQESKIAQVITNLLSNAINYSVENSQINVSVYRQETNAVLEIQDFGIGISEEDQKHIFERFYRVDKARSRDSGGTGLGLSITKHIVEAHGGQIAIESEIDKGSTFKVFFKDK